MGAHPDDVEFICSGTLSLLRMAGCEIHVATLTLGDAGSFEFPAAEIRQIRRLEAIRSCELLGASYHYVGFSDFRIFYDDISHRRVTSLIREVDPWIVFTHPPSDYLIDHEATSRLVRNACFAGPVPNYDTSSFTQKRAASEIPYLFYAHPLEGVDIYGREAVPHFYVDISDQLKLKEKLLACHESQRNWLKEHHGMDEYLENMRRWGRQQAEHASEICGRKIKLAEGYCQHLGHAYPKDNPLAELFPNRMINL